MYKIIGIDKYYQKETYFTGDNLQDCLKYLNHLKTSCLSSTVKFKWIKV